MTPDIVRAADQVAFRALALFSVIGLALGANRSEVLDWLTENDLWRELTASEVGFIDTPRPSKKQIVNATWLSERLVVLLWSLQHISRMPPPDQQCDTSVFQHILPPFAVASVREFVEAATLRPDGELIDMATEITQLHSEARDAKTKNRTLPRRVDIEIIQERHYAVNWIIGYEGLPWDEITTDT